MTFPVQILPYFRHFKRLFAGPGTLQSAAYLREILFPEEKVHFPPSIYVEGQLDKVTGAPAESTKDAEIAAITRLTGTNSATIAYRLKDVAFVDGSVYVGNLRYFITENSRFGSGPYDVHEFKDAALVSSFYGTKYFGHWLSDDCCANLLATELGRPALCLPIDSYFDADCYLSALGQLWAPVVRARIADLTVFADYSFNALRRARYQTLRKRVSARFSRNGRRSLVYLKRGKTGSRRVIQNEDIIIDILAKRGFIVVDPETTPVERIMEILVTARIVVSLEGSHIAHCLYCVPLDSGLLVLQPADRFALNHREWANCLGVKFGFVVGDASEAGYLFCTQDILRTLDLIITCLGV
jgi:hypothetical protein